jgi:endonuclease-3
MTRTERAQEIARILLKTYPDARCALNHRNPLELLVATILSAQCTDERVNRVTPHLFQRYRTAKDYAQADLAALQKMVQPTGFYRQKAKTLKALGQAIWQRFGGQVPRRMEDLVSLPGVGRKTANVVLGTCFDIPGVVVDTHVRRLAHRMGLSDQSDPDRIELDLMQQIPKAQWTQFSHALIWHGRRICKARNPVCLTCPVESLCPKNGVSVSKRRSDLSNQGEGCAGPSRSRVWKDRLSRSASSNRPLSLRKFP